MNTIHATDTMAAMAQTLESLIAGNLMGAMGAMAFCLGAILYKFN